MDPQFSVYKIFVRFLIILMISFENIIEIPKSDLHNSTEGRGQNENRPNFLKVTNRTFFGRKNF